MDDMAMFGLVVRFAEKPEIICFCVPKQVGEGDDVKYPAKEVWEKLDPGASDVVEIKAFYPLDAAGGVIEPRDWLKGVRGNEYKPTLIKLDCRHLLHAELY